MINIKTDLVNDEEHCTVPAGAGPIVKPVEVTIDAGAVEVQIDGKTVLVGMLNGDVTVAVAEGNELEVYGKNHPTRK